MLLSERQIRALVADLILEGYKDDQRYLIEKHPEHTDTLALLQPKWINWLITRFGDSPTREEVHPFEDALITIEKFARKDAGIGEKYRANAQFREAIDTRFPPNSRSWAAPNDITSLTVDDMDLILGLSERKKQSVDVRQEEDIEGDRVGKVGPWNLWVPTTMEKSCKIAGYDPVTRNPKTTWCTARTAGSNLFYHYVGRQNEDIVLFYIIKDDPSEDNDWLSVGFLNGKPVLDGRNGGLSVNRQNAGLTPESLKAVLGDDFDPIMDALKQKAAALKGVHPAKEKVRAAGQDLDLLKKMLKGHSEDENKSFLEMITKLPSISPEVTMFIVNTGDTSHLRKLAYRDNITPEALDAIIDRAAKSPDVIAIASRNANVSPETIERMANSSERQFKLLAAESPKTSPETLRRLAHELPSKSSVARNPNTPIDVLIDFSKSDDVSLFNDLVNNKNLPNEAIDNILDSPSLSGVRADDHGYLGNSLAGTKGLTPEQLVKVYNMFKNSRGTTLLHPSLPMDILNAALESPRRAVRAQAHKNPQTPPERLASFLADPGYTAYQHVTVLRNPNVPPEALIAAYADENLGKERFDELALNPNAPLDLLVQLIKKSTPYTRELVTHHPKVTDEMLKKLSKDRNENVATAAKERIKQRQAAGVNEALARVIRRLLR